MIQTIILPIMRVLGTATLSVTIMLGGPIALSLSQVPDALPTENETSVDGCTSFFDGETPPCTID
jgi:hypothetical protein